MKNAIENCKNKLVISRAVQVWIALAGTVDNK